MGQARLSGRLRTVFSFLTMLTFLLVTLQFVASRGSIADPDIWWHLRNAEYLFQHHQLPRYDIYSFTVAGAPWISHEWLAEVPYLSCMAGLGSGRPKRRNPGGDRIYFSGLVISLLPGEWKLQGFLRSLLLLHTVG